MVAIVDYGVGNLFSLRCSLAAVGAEAVVTGDPALLRRADRLLLPGVGAFGDAAEQLRQCGLDRVIIEQAQAGTPLLGVCLGMQLLFETSYEYGAHRGLGLIPGVVRPIRPLIPPQLKIPHIGWNALQLRRDDCPLLRRVREGDYVYFVHSYYAADCDDDTVATAEYGLPLTAVVQKNNVFGCQFHPEKSGTVGLEILRAFCEMEVGV